MTLSLSPEALSTVQNAVSSEGFKRLQSFLMFIGHAHSGHSIIGAILDAHPDVAVANEINVPKIIKDHPQLCRNDLLKIALYHSKKEHKQWHNTEYKYHIEGGFQGETEQPVVLGDKKGGGSTRVIMNNPWILDRLVDFFGSQLKLIHVLRNPIDNIAAYAYYWEEPLGQKHLDRYVENLEATLMIRERLPSDQCLFVDQTEFLTKPQRVLGRIFDFLGVSHTPEQINTYASIVNSNIKSRADRYALDPAFLERVRFETEAVLARLHER